MEQLEKMLGRKLTDKDIAELKANEKLSKKHNKGTAETYNTYLSEREAVHTKAVRLRKLEKQAIQEAYEDEKAAREEAVLTKIKQQDKVRAEELERQKEEDARNKEIEKANLEAFEAKKKAAMDVIEASHVKFQEWEAKKVPHIHPTHKAWVSSKPELITLDHYNVGTWERV